MHGKKIAAVVKRVVGMSPSPLPRHVVLLREAKQFDPKIGISDGFAIG